MSGKYNFRYFALALIIFLLAAGIASALSEDFNAYSQSGTISACACGITEGAITVTNTGDITSSYNIFASGSAAPFSTVADSTFSLNPGESKSTINYINVPCSASGDYGLNINVTTEFGLSKTISEDVSTKRCANVNLVPKQNYQESCPCSPLSYEFELTNTGSYADTYLLNISNYNSYIALSENSVTLQPGESKEIFAYVNLPCEIYGLQDLELSAIAQKSGFMAVTPFQAKINSCYDYSLDAQGLSLCSGDSATSQITINNTADIANTYALSTDQNFATIYNNSLFVPPHSSGATYMTMDASGVSPNNYTITVNSVSERGNLQDKKTVSATVDKCYGLDLSVEKTSDQLAGCDNSNYKVTVSNTGSKPAAVKLGLDGPDWASLSSYNLFIPPNSDAATELNLNVPCNASGTSWAKITASLVNGSVSTAQNLKYGITPVENAYLLSINPKKTDINYNGQSVLVSVQNKGTRQGTYFMALDSPSWMSLSENQLTLDVGEEKTIELQTQPANDTPEDDYKVTLTANLKGTDVAYKNVFTVSLRTAPWYVKAFAFVEGFVVANWIWIAAIVAALVIILLLVFIIKKIAKKIKERPKKAPAPKIAEPEEHLRLSVNRLQKKSGSWARVLGAIVLVLIALGAGFAVYSNYDAISNALTPVKQLGQFEPLVQVNRSEGLEGYGNTVYVRGSGELIVPVTIQNRAPSAVDYAVNVQNTSWITTNTSVLELGVNDTGSMDLIVNPTPDIQDGNYLVTIGLNIADKNVTYNEAIDLKIMREKSFFEDYFNYLVAGLGILVILIAILRLTRKSGFEIKPEKVNVKIAPEEKKRSKAKIFGVVLLVLIVLGVAGYFAYDYYSGIQTAPQEQQKQFAIDFSSIANETATLNVARGQQIIIPIDFVNNFNSLATYDINVPNETDWIQTTEQQINLDPGANESVNITSTPYENVSSGYYEVNIVGNVDAEGISYVKTIGFYVQDTGFLSKINQALFGYGVFVVLGVIVLVFAVTSIELKRRRKKKLEMIAEIREEIEQEKASRRRKTSFNPKKSSKK